MTILEFLLLNIFYTGLFLTYRKEREYVWTQLTHIAATLMKIALNNPVTLQILKLLTFFQSQYPSIKREGKTLHISFVERKNRYDIYLPYNRHSRQVRKYALRKGEEIKHEFTLPPGLTLTCTKEDFACDEIIER